MEGAGTSGSHDEIDSARSEYDVFLCFRGTDTRYRFADHLYESMIAAGIHVFRYQQVLQSGKDIKGEIERGIENSRTYVVVFSRDYASSVFCLQDLAMIVDYHRDLTARKIIVPIFYGVDPQDVGLRTDLYWKDLYMHGENYKHEIVQWEKALAEVSQIGGWHVRGNEGEGRLVKLIVRDVVCKLKIGNRSLLMDSIIGIDDQVDEMMKLLKLDSLDVRLVLVHGMAGTGKTTLAKIIFNRIFCQFEGFCFLENVRELSTNEHGMVELQKRLLVNILGTQCIEVPNSSHGIIEIRRRLQGKRVLIVLDDVNKRDQLDKLAGNCDQFGLGTRIIVTTRDRSLGDGLQSCEVFDMKKLNDDQALNLFCRHAFGSDVPSDDYVILSKQIVGTLDHLPLAIKVIGQYLYHQSKESWKHALQKLKEHSQQKAMEMLLMRYNLLENTRKQLDLEVGLLLGEMLEKSTSYTWQDKSFWMHDQLRDMGGQTVQLKGHSRPWVPEDVLNEVQQKKLCTEDQSKKGAFPPLEYDTAEGEAMEIEGDDNKTKVEMMKEGADEPLVDLESSLATMQLAAIGHVIGMDCQVESVIELMNTRCDNALVVGICGPDGIGKTTLAEAVYNRVSSQFDACCFLEEIKEAIPPASGIQSLPIKFIYDILGPEYNEGISHKEVFDILQEVLPHMKVLIVLDDNEAIPHIKEFLKDHLNLFGSGSRIILTAGKSQVIVESFGGLAEIHDHGMMNADLALELFSQYVFGKNSPEPGYSSIAKTIVNGLMGYPLLIEVIGSFLHGKQIEEFRKMSKLIDSPPQDFWDMLTISYEALDYIQKQIFLDIACFVVNEDVWTAMYLWYECLSMYPNHILMPLAKVGRDDQLRLHSSLRRLGQKIVCTEDTENSGICSRIFVHQTAMDVIKNGKGTKNVEALCLNFGNHQSKPEELVAANFKNMPKLRYLKLDSATITGDFNNVFPNLRWLQWRRCPVDFRATNVNTEDLVILDLSGSAIRDDWEGWVKIQMVNLKVLNLANCANLLVTPPFESFQKLERLILEGCLRLVDIDPSIGALKHLVFLNLKFCRELNKLPKELADLKDLRELLIDGTGVEEIPWIGELKQLEILSSANCISLGSLPNSIGHLEKLKKLSLRDCRRVQDLPDSIGSLGSSLVELDISGTGIAELPASISGLRGLKVLRMDSCFISELPGTIGHLRNLEEIHASRCRNLKVIHSDITGLSQLRILELRYASISNLPEEIGFLRKLEILDLLHCDKIKQLPRLPTCVKVLM